MELTLRNNKLVLVGENGTGKSTILGIVFYVLTRQWDRLVETPFTAVEVTFSGASKIRVALDDLRDLDKVHPGVWSYLRRRIGSAEAELLRRELSTRPSGYWRSVPDRLFQLRVQFGIEQEILLDALRALRAEEEGPRRMSPLATATEQLDEAMTAQVLFLPTYRRIERDLQHIFPQMRLERDTRVFQRKVRESGGYVELVQFGMKDVKETIDHTMHILEREFRADQSRLTGDYLRDVLRGAHKINSGYVDVLSTSADSVEAALARLGDTILEPNDCQELRALVSQIEETHAIPTGQEVAAHFLAKLVRMYERQQQRERSVQLLTKTCNRYLSNKALHFDPLHFVLRLELSGLRPPPARDEDESNALTLDVLSSGEKQIVSLFTHVLLSKHHPDNPPYFVIIDEPELSISVDWQRMLLPDLLDTERCEGLIAVTHSPFIFENQLAEYAHSVAEFLTDER